MLRANNVTSFYNVLNVSNYVACWRILWHASVNLFTLWYTVNSILTACFTYVFAKEFCLYWIWNQFILYCGKEILRSVFILNIKIYTFCIFLRTFLSIYSRNSNFVLLPWRFYKSLDITLFNAIPKYFLQYIHHPV